MQSEQVSFEMRVREAVMRVLTSHPCDPGLISAWCDTWVEIVVGSCFALMVLSEYPVFLPPQDPTTPNLNNYDQDKDPCGNQLGLV